MNFELEKESLFANGNFFLTILIILKFSDPACSKYDIENGIVMCTQSNMRKSICTNACDDGYTLECYA